MDKQISQNRKEDATTEELCFLLQKSQSTRNAFLSFLDLKWQDKLNPATLSINTQVPIDGGRMDLLIRSGNAAFIIEVKVNDVQKVYQIENYYNYWKKTYSTVPSIFWLIRKRAPGLIGSEHYLTDCVLWNEVATMLNSLNLDNPAERCLLEAFLAYLKRENILLKEGESVLKKRREKGIDRVRACRILQSVASQFENCEYKIDETNELPIRLLIGKKTWHKKFNDGLPMRLRMFLVPNQSHPAGIHLWMRICLYHYKSYLIVKWSRILDRYFSELRYWFSLSIDGYDV